MTARAEPKTEHRSTDGRFSFQMCGCNPNVQHGYFHLPTGDKASTTFYSKGRALELLEEVVADGRVPKDQKSAIAEDIALSELPETSEHSHDGIPKPSMLEMLLGILEPNVPAPAGTYDIMIVDGKATLFINGEERDARRRRGTKSEARNLVTDGVDLGFVGKEDETKMMKQIEESTLPE